MTEFWSGRAYVLDNGYDMEFQARIALVMLEKWGLVAGDVRREDSQGRAVLDVMPIDVMVQRAFDVAAAFVTVAESRGLIRQPVKTEAEIASEIGEIHGHQESARYDISLSHRVQRTSEQAPK